jgi:F0F1-type ATP synthase assembly protein I
MKEYFKHLFTDAANRPEIKTVLGVLSVIVALVYICVTKDAVGFGAISGFGAAMLVTSAIGDSVVDRNQK